MLHKVSVVIEKYEMTKIQFNGDKVLKRKCL